MDIFSNFGLWGAGWTGWIIPFLFGLSVVVFFHELGHFLVARWCGVRVLTFSVGFGPEIVGFNDRYGTRWKLSWIPLGGYVKFFGDDNAASVPDESRRRQHDRGGEAPELLPSAGGTPRGHRRGRADRQFHSGHRDLCCDLRALRPADDDRTGRCRGARFRRRSSWSQARRRRARDRWRGHRKLLRHAAGRQRQCRPHADIPDRSRRRADDADGDARAHARQGRLRQQVSARACWASAGRWRRRRRQNRDMSVRWRRSGWATKETWFIIDRTFSFIGGLFAGRECADQLGGPIRIAQISGQVATLGFMPVLHLAGHAVGVDRPPEPVSGARCSMAVTFCSTGSRRAGAARCRQGPRKSAFGSVSRSS